MDGTLVSAECDLLSRDEGYVILKCVPIYWMIILHSIE